MLEAVLAVVAAMIYAWTCVRFYIWIAGDAVDVADLREYPVFWTTACLFWPFVMLLGMYLVFLDIKLGPEG